MVQQGGLWVLDVEAGEQPQPGQQLGQQRQWRVGPSRTHEAASKAAQLLSSFLESRGNGLDLVQALLQKFGVVNVANSSAGASSGRRDRC